MFCRLFDALHLRHRRPRSQRQGLPHVRYFQALEQRVLLSTLSGRVWLDANLNGIADPDSNGYESHNENGLADVAIVLYNADTDQAVANTPTDNNGLFTFTELEPGNYYLQFQTSFIDEVTYNLTFKNALFAGANLPTMDSDANTLTGKTDLIVLGSDETVDDLAAGYAPIINLLSLTALSHVGQTVEITTGLTLPDDMTDYDVRIQWFDGDTSHTPAVTESSYHNTIGDLQIIIDFDTYDSNNFFDTQFKRDLLQYAAGTIANRFGDRLTAITPDADNTWSMVFNRPDTHESVTVAGPALLENQIKIFAGGYQLGATEELTSLSEGEPGTFLATGTADFQTNIATRGQDGIYNASTQQPLDSSLQTDHALWGGSISFVTELNLTDTLQLPWHFGLDEPQSGTYQVDFLSVAMHELMRLFGFGSANTWDNQTTLNLIDGDTQITGTFNGSATTTYFGQPVPLNTLTYDADAFANGAQTLPAQFASDTAIDPDTLLKALMVPNVTTGTRTMATRLDYMVMDDLGWDLLDAPSQSTDGLIQSTHTYTQPGTHQITVTLHTSLGDLSYQTEVQVSGILQVISVTPNAAGDALELPSEETTFYSSSIQRSQLKNLIITFNQAVSGMTTDDLVLKHIDQQGNVTFTPLTDIPISSTDSITFTVDLQSLTLDDGVYKLIIKDNVTEAILGQALDGNVDDIAGGDFLSVRFHQLGGDFNGDGQFNQYDLSPLAHYWNGHTPNPPSYININGDSVVNTADTIHFAQWMQKLDLTVQEVEVTPMTAMTVIPPATSSDTFAVALAAYANKQASLTVVSNNTSKANAVADEDIIGQWMG